MKSIAIAALTAVALQAHTVLAVAEWGQCEFLLPFYQMSRT